MTGGISLGTIAPKWTRYGRNGVQGSYYIEDVFHYYSMAYSSHALGFYHSAQAIGFDEFEPGEAANVEEFELTEVVGTEVVVDTRMVVAGIGKQKCRDSDSMT